ncbi:MAG: hypothetical protein ACLT76_01535 [Clostridium fessum]
MRWSCLRPHDDCKLNGDILAYHYPVLDIGLGAFFHVSIGSVDEDS